MMADTHLVAKSLAPVRTDVGVPLAPTATFESCPADLDVLFVPSGLKCTVAVLQDRPTLDFLAEALARAT
jgi:putative intracellular protease/amidase